MRRFLRRTTDGSGRRILLVATMRNEGPYILE
jgi:hypothetical protein